MNLSPRQLRVFVALAQSLSFSRTAEHFCVSQPTLSKIVRTIELELGVALFERTTRTVKLTPDGEALVPVAARLAADFDTGLTELAEVARRRTHRIAVAALPTLAALLLPSAIAALRREVPNALVRVHDVYTDEAIDLLRTRKVDLAFTGVDASHQDLAYAEFVREPYVALCSKRHPLPRAMTRWSEAALNDLPLISMPRGTGTRQNVEAAFARAGLQFRPVLELLNLTSMPRFVASGFGVALLPLSGAQLVLTSELSIRYLDGAPERSIGVVTRRETVLPPLADALIRSVRQHASELGGRKAPGASRRARTSRR